MKFSVGMAVFPDAAGVEEAKARFTILSLLVHHSLVGEVVIVDNNPSEDSRLKALAEKVPDRVRYVPMPSPVGTAPPRNRVFQEARFPHVVCLDAHVLLYPVAFGALLKFYHDHGEACPDLLHGFMLDEAGQVHATHMNDQWRADMWGTWGKAWKHPSGFLFSCVHPGGNRLMYASLDEPDRQVSLHPSYLGHGFGAVHWAGHEKKLERLGCRLVDEPFECPGHGMGFFACRRDAWLDGGHFHEGCRGFGGEEMTTAWRFRQLGRKVWSLPGVRWWHDFSNQNEKRPYPDQVYLKARNYVLEFKRLGMDPSPVRDVFNEFRIDDAEWQQVLAGVENPVPTEPTRTFKVSHVRLGGKSPSGA